MCTEVGRYPTQTAKMQGPHPWLGKTAASQGDSMGCEAELLPPPQFVGSWIPGLWQPCGADWALLQRDLEQGSSNHNGACNYVQN